MRKIKSYESFLNYITENSDFDKISVDIENFGDRDMGLGDVDYDYGKPIGQVLKYLFDLISGSNEFESYEKESNESDFKLSIKNNDNDRKVEIEFLHSKEDGIIMKFTDGDDVFQPTIVSVEEKGGAEMKEDPWGGSYEEYSEEGYAFELDTEKFKSSLSAIANYLNGKYEYIN
jgi:hypothetical protein